MKEDTYSTESCLLWWAHGSYNNKFTNSEAELEHVDGPFLFQEIHETEEKVLLLPDFLQLQLQNLTEKEGAM